MQYTWTLWKPSTRYHTIDYCIKLDTGISDRTCTWIKNFLNNRQQCVQVNGSKSHWKSVTSGIPRGPVLGPILFVIFIDDLSRDVLSDELMFADDTKIFRQISEQTDREIFNQIWINSSTGAKPGYWSFTPRNVKSYQCITEHHSRYSRILNENIWRGSYNPWNSRFGERRWSQYRQ